MGPCLTTLSYIRCVIASLIQTADDKKDFIGDDDVLQNSRCLLTKEPSPCVVGWWHVRAVCSLSVVVAKAVMAAER